MSSKKIKPISEEEKLQLHLSRSYAERFYILMRLIKLNKKLAKAKIIHPDS